MKEIIRRHYIFSGRVQGVGFRYRAYHEASRLGISGWVRNLYNETVEMEAQGAEDDLNALVWAIDQSRPIRIEGIETEDIPVDRREKGFRMLN